MQSIATLVIRFTAVIFVSSSLCGCGTHPPTAVEQQDGQLREEAAKCVSMLRQFGEVHSDFFPDGLDKPKEGVTHESVSWPPPRSYSWRVVILPFMEQTILYEHIQYGTDGFKLTGTFSDKDMDRLPYLKKQVAKMPDWLSLPRWKEDTGKSIYRQFMVKDKPNCFIVVESSERVLWLSSTDNLELVENKPVPKMGGNFTTGTFALCGDGSVRFLPKSLKDDDLKKALLTGEGGQKLRGLNPAHTKEVVAKIDLGKHVRE